MDTLHKYLFATDDYGRTIYPHKLPFTPSEVITHPTDAMVIIAHDTTDPQQKVCVAKVAYAH